MSLPERFGVNLRKARLAASLSQEELGLECGLDRSEVGMLERGEREPKLTTLVKLTGGLGIDPKQLHAGLAWDAAAGHLDVIPARLPTGRVKRPPGHRPSR
jgi:transcriptional regulator with XRE-family HTH domain